MDAFCFLLFLLIIRKWIMSNTSLRTANPITKAEARSSRGEQKTRVQMSLHHGFVCVVIYIIVNIKGLE